MGAVCGRVSKRMYSGGIEMRSNKLVKAVMCLLSVLLIVTALPLYAAAEDGQYDAESFPYFGEDEKDYLDEVKVKQQGTQAIIEYVYRSYAYGSPVYRGTGQCYGYAEMIRQLFGTTYRERRYGVKVTKKLLYNKLKDLRPGTHVRFSAAANGSRNPSHSIVLLKVNKNWIWYTDGSYDYNNGIRVDKRPLADLAYSTQGNGYKYLVFTREPAGSIPTVDKPDVKAIDDYINTTNVTLAWRPVRGAKSYIVYSSTRKYSGYKKVATVKKSRYVDKTKKISGKVYYKIKAVKSGGRTVASKPVKANKRLTVPKVYMTMYADADEPYYVLTWEAVKGATKYNIYSMNWTTEKRTKLASVKGTKWKHKLAKKNSGSVELYITAASGRKGSESDPAVLEYYPRWFTDFN